MPVYFSIPLVGWHPTICIAGLTSFKNLEQPIMVPVVAHSAYKVRDLLFCVAAIRN